MNNEKQIKARFQQKTDTSEKWNIASSKGFIPKKGEIIVYQDEQNSKSISKIKIGDGKNAVEQLDFIGADSGSGGIDIVDVIELPTFGEKNKIYRILKGKIVETRTVLNSSKCHIKDWEGTPTEPGNGVIFPISESEISYECYYNINDGKIWGYINEEVIKILAALSSLPEGQISGFLPKGWIQIYEFIGVISNFVETSYGGVITSPQQATDISALYLYLTQDLYSYINEEWIPIDADSNWYGEADGSEIFNFLGNEASGKFSHAEGKYTKAIGDYSHAEGNSSKAIGDTSHAEGSETQATAISAHAEGWKTEATNNCAHAEGAETKAYGNSSHAEGSNTLANNACSHTEGYFTKALNDYAHAEGSHTEASGKYSHAEGLKTEAIGHGSHAEGGTTKSIGVFSHSGGIEAVAKGYYSFAHGKNVLATGEGALAIGDGMCVSKILKESKLLPEEAQDLSALQLTVTSVNKNKLTLASSLEVVQALKQYIDSVQFTGFSAELKDVPSVVIQKSNMSFSNNTITVTCDTVETLSNNYIGKIVTEIWNGVAHANRAIMLGKENIAAGSDSLTIGRLNYASGAMSIAGGTQSKAKGYISLAIGDRAEAVGHHSFSFGFQTIAHGQKSYAFGDNTMAYGENSQAIGESTTAYGANSQAVGTSLSKFDTTTAESDIVSSWTNSSKKFLLAYGKGAHAQGAGTLAFGDRSHAEGCFTLAQGINSHSEGYGTKTTQEEAHAEGLSTIASGIGAHSEGVKSVASEEGSHSEGIECKASGKGSHAEGNYTQAQSANSHAEGNNTVANISNQHVQGRYNSYSSKDNYAHVLGNGSSSKRSNAHTIDWNGNAWFSGNVQVGGSEWDGDNNSTFLATRGYVDSAIGEVETVLDQIIALQESLIGG